MSVMMLRDLLDECGGSIKTGPFGTTLKASEYSDSGVPVISTGEVGYGSLVVKTKTPRVDATVTDRLSEYVLQADDIVFARKGSIDRSARVREHEAGFFLGSDGLRLRVGIGHDPRFFAYQMLSPATRKWLVQHAGGSTMPSLNQEILGRVPVVVPPLDEQQRIAGVFGALDDLIDTNRDLRELVRSAAATSYRMAINSGGRDVALDDCVHFHNRDRAPLSKSERSGMPGEYPYYGATGVVDTVGRYLFDDVHVLVGEDGSVIEADGSPVIQMVWGRYWVNNHAHVLSAVGISNGLLRQALLASNVAPLVTGAVQAKLSMGRLKTLRVRLPQDVEASDHIEVLACAERQLSDEVLALARTRDELLPLLMSGRVRVGSAESLVR